MTITFGLYLLLPIIRLSRKKTKVNAITQLLDDSLTVYRNRLTSSISQVTLYISIILFVVATLFNKPLPSSQLISFAIGSFTMIILLSITTRFIPSALSKIIDQNNHYFSKSLHMQFNIAHGLSYISLGIIFLGLLFTYSSIGAENTLGYSVGIIMSGLFLRIGSGLFKTASDICEDNISKIEKKIPHFDKRNPASILDIAGDVTGKMLGTQSELISSIILTITSAFLFAQFTHSNQALPFWIINCSIFSSIVAYIYGTLRIKFGTTNNILLETLYTSILMSGLSMFYLLHHIDPSRYKTLFIPYLIGLIGAIFISFTTEMLTSHKYPISKSIALEAENGPVIAIFNGLANGLRSIGFYLVYLVAVIIPAFYIGHTQGIILATLGMLASTKTLLAISLFPSLATLTYKTNALSKTQEASLKHNKKIHQIGYTTVALGHGFLTGIASMASLSLLLTFITAFVKTPIQLEITLLTGLFIGAIIPLICSGALLRKLSKLIIKSYQEIIRQFKEIPYLSEDKAKPDMTKITDQTTCFCMDSMITPGILMALPPIILGYSFGIHILIGIIIGIFVTTISFSFIWGNTGDTTNQARQGFNQGFYGGTNTQSFDSILIADNVGDAYKDLLAPTMTTLMKIVITLSALLMALI